MDFQYLTNDNPPPAESLLEYDVEPGTVFTSANPPPTQSLLEYDVEPGTVFISNRHRR